jgi:hypothetical protein
LSDPKYAESPFPSQQFGAICRALLAMPARSGQIEASEVETRQR